MATTVAELYRTYLNRSPDAAGLSFWTDAVKKGPTTGIDQEEIDAFIAAARSAGETVRKPKVVSSTSGAEVQPNKYSGEGSFQQTAGTQGNIRSLGLGDDFQEYEEIGTEGPYTIYRVRSAYGDDLGTIRVQTGGGVAKFLEGVAPLIGFAAGVGGLGAMIGSGLGLTGTAANVVGNAIASGITTGAITGDFEKGLVAAALAAGGSYLSGSGALGDAMDTIGLGEYKSTLGVLNSAQVGDVQFVAADAAQLAAQGLDAAAIQQNLITSGVDATVAAGAANLAASGASVDQIAADIKSFTGGNDIYGEVDTGAATGVTTTTGAESGGLGGTTVDGKTFSQTVADAQTGRFGTTGEQATFSGIDQSSQLAGGTETGMFGNVGTGGFGNALGSASDLATNLANAGFGQGTANNLAGLTAAGTGATGLLGGATAAGAESLITNLANSGASTNTIIDEVKKVTGLDTKTVTSLVSKVVGTLTGGGVGGLLSGGIDLATSQGIYNNLQNLATDIQNKAVASGQAAQVAFTPYTVTSGGGTANITGTGATTAAAQPYQDIRAAAQQQALATLGAINPAQAAQTLYGQVEALAAPGREREQLALQQRLQRQGLLGFGTTLPTTGGGARTVNPLFESLLSAQEAARAQQALSAQQFGTTEAGRQAQLAQGLLGQAQSIDAAEMDRLAAARGLSADQTQLALRNAEAQRLSTLQGLQYAVPLYTSAANVRSGQISSAGSQAQNALSGLLGLFNQGFDPNAITSGLDISGESQATQNLINDLQQYGIF